MAVDKCQFGFLRFVIALGTYLFFTYDNYPLYTFHWVHAIPNLQHLNQFQFWDHLPFNLRITCGSGIFGGPGVRFLKSPESFSGPKKMYLKTDKSIRLKFLVWRKTSVLVKKILKKNRSVVQRFELLLQLFRCETFSGPSRNRSFAGLYRSHRALNHPQLETGHICWLTQSLTGLLKYILIKHTK